MTQLSRSSALLGKSYAIALLAILLASLVYAATIVTPPPGGTSSGVASLNCDEPDGAACVDPLSNKTQGALEPYPEVVVGTPSPGSCNGTYHWFIDDSATTLSTGNRRARVCFCPDDVATDPVCLESTKLGQITDGTNAFTPADGDDWTLPFLGGNGITTALDDTDPSAPTMTFATVLQEKCQVLDNVTDSDDNTPLGSFANAVTITGVWAHYMGAAPTLAATFTLEDGSGNQMTITGTNPTVAAPNANATIAAVTAGNTLAAGELLRFDVTNTPNPATDTYQLCVRYSIP
jgi:hypothetical protein